MVNAVQILVAGWVACALLAAILDWGRMIASTQKRLPAGYDLTHGRHYVAFVLFYLTYCFLLGPGGLIIAISIKLLDRRDSAHRRNKR